jgi:hypothetical protein
MRGIQYAVPPAIEPILHGILDHPLEPVIGRRAAPTRWRMMTAMIV